MLGDLFESTLAGMFVESGFAEYMWNAAYNVDVRTTIDSGFRKMSEKAS